MVGEEGGGGGELRSGAGGGERAGRVVAGAAADAVQDAPGRVGAQQSALLVVVNLIEQPGDGVLGAGEVRVALG